MWIQFLRPSATGRIEFSARLVLSSSSGHSRNRVSFLHSAGITEPEDLDIDAIAFACGATILRQPLTGCEANIIGSGDKAIITVNIKSIAGHQRFSSGHELGHWMKDRGQNAFGCSKSQMNSEWTGNNAETRANRFASDLLLPLSMFVPIAKGRSITLETVIYLAGVFRMSRTATAIRLVQHLTATA